MVRMAGSLRDITEGHQMADALKTSEETWRGLVEHAPDFILVVDPDGTIRFINRVGPDYDIRKVIGASAFDFVPPEQRASLRAAFDSVVRTRQPTRLESTVTGPNGATSWYVSRIGPIERDGRVDALILITTDFTERILAEEERQKFLRWSRIAAISSPC